MANNLINDLVSASPNRRSFLKKLAAASAAVGAMTIAGSTPAEAQTATEIEVLQFALNLEYLEAEFYTYALTGASITAYGIGINGLANGSNPTTGGSVTGGSKVDFSNNLVFTQEIAAQIATDERDHVVLLRTALGSKAIAQPNIHLGALGFGFANQNDFLRLARIFEDIGVSAYSGAAGLLSTPAIITTAARILAAEAQHVGSIRTQVARLNVTTSPLDGGRSDTSSERTSDDVSVDQPEQRAGCDPHAGPGASPRLWRAHRGHGGRLLPHGCQRRDHDEHGARDIGEPGDVAASPLDRQDKYPVSPQVSCGSAGFFARVGCQVEEKAKAIIWPLRLRACSGLGQSGWTFGPGFFGKG